MRRQSVLPRFTAISFAAIQLAIALLGMLASPARAARYAELDDMRIAELTQQMETTPRGFGPPCSDRAAWSRSDVLARTTALRVAADKLLDQTFPAWDDNAYLEYSRDGQRPAGERMMNARKAWLYPLVMAECVEYKGRFLPAIARTLNELDTQPTWTWPAHDKGLRNFRQRDYEVDLLAADIAHDLAQTLYMLGDRLAPNVRRDTLAALETRVFAPFRRSMAGGKDNWWLHVDHNWNAVCLKGVVDAALAVLPAREDRALFAAAGEHYIRHYVSGFSDDGYTAEGPGYWNYGLSHFALLREALTQSTGGQLDLFADPKVRNMALYGIRIQMFPGNVAAFGDASPNTRMDALTLAYANAALGLGLTTSLASLPISARQYGNEAPIANAMLALFGQPQRVADDKPVMLDPLRSYFDTVGVLVARPQPDSADRLAVTIKAGGNANHSHNDIGAYSIALGSEQPTGDVGKTNYSSKTFSKARYTIPGISSWGHPVPLVAGQLQQEATSVRPRVLATHFTEHADDITIDLAPAYAIPSLRQLTRTLRYQRDEGGTVDIEDRFAFVSPQTFEVALTTLGAWRQREDGTLELWQKHERLLASIEASAAYTVSAEKSVEEGLAFTRIALRLDSPQAQGFLRVRFTPAR